MVLITSKTAMMPLLKHPPPRDSKLEPIFRTESVTCLMLEAAAESVEESARAS